MENKMDRIVFLLLLFFTLNSCSRNNKESVAISPLHDEQKINENIQMDEIYEIDLPKMEINKENLLSGFPESPDYFMNNNFSVTLRKITGDEKLISVNTDIFKENNSAIIIEIIDMRNNNVGPIYFGIEPVYVTGKNFRIIYATEFLANGEKNYEIRRIRLTGDTFFNYWNQYFGAKKSDLIKSWGEPNTGTNAYFNESDWYGIGFTFEKTNDKIIEIQIEKGL
jgi:hypothetical protein